MSRILPMLPQPPAPLPLRRVRGANPRPPQRERVRAKRAGEGPLQRLIAAMAALALLASCATAERALLPTDQQPAFRQPGMPAPVIQRDARSADGAAGASAGAVPLAPPATVIAPLPPSTTAPPPKPAATAATPAFPGDEPRDTALNFDQTPLPTFIQVVFGTVLKVNVLVDPAVAARQDLVTLRTSKPQNRAEVLETARLLLKTYGVAVVDLGGAFRIVPDAQATNFSPDIRRGRALPDTPQPMRPVFMFYELQYTRIQDVGNWLRTIFGNRITITDDANRNGFLISGQTDSVATVIEAIQVLDQPLLRGRFSARIEPAFWTADDLARRLSEVLTAQGFSVTLNPAQREPILLLPIGPINTIIAFAVSQEALDLVTRWTRELDQPGSGRGGSGSGIFTYAARNTDARELAKTMQELISGPAPAGAQGQPAQRPGSRVVVNPATNTLIFQGAPESYTQLVGLLQELDRPPRTALIEVTVAEVRLGESENLGIEWALNNRSIGDGYTATGGTLGNLSIGSSGLLVRILTPGGQTRAVINALASQNKARVLSSPRVMARSGESATIQVGQEVPIITSQQTTGSTVGGGIGIQPGILQTVQYKQTGVILRVRPVIHSSGRIELDVQQEVSSAAATNTGVNVSPTFSTRKVETKLSLGDAETVLLAGLISQNQSRSDAGIPVLKDIPGVGQLFRTNTDQTDRTELVVLITPYLVNNDFEARSITEAFRNQLGPWARTQGGAVTTLPRTAPPGQSAPVGPRITTQPGEVPPGAASGTAAGNAPGAQSAPAPAAPLSATSAAPAPAPAGAAPAAPPGGQPVNDPKLLEDLQRAITAPPAGGKPPARPATQPSRPQPQSKP